ncbi:phosphonate ABC transporter, permease protein PhnE [Asticcacaulis biprosthecium C19]|uniref:Phosphonate ABC transporter, permease protein PhnE n=1 Tax=Asticcacaulis biprosthecium C19 TaxID=715226 RepID=F4QJ70_9CAUL|nr:phosphonate ABC transporter, permease protein PhnE [Asticcacaulis biprosthecium]EGF91901.1 phosphonate ABC transporter, permease protein PhnE [Asticcacaulis biprosthecium C19]
MSQGDATALTPPSPSVGTRATNWGLTIAVVILLFMAFKPAKIAELGLLVENWPNTVEYTKGYLHPNFKDLFKIYLPEMWVTIAIAVWGTVLSVFLAIPLALLGSSNIAPQWIVQPVRRFMDLLRSMNEIVLATAFFVAVGPGALAGVLAMALHNAGVLAKLFSEAVEAIDKAPVEGVRATGGSRLHEVIWGVIPQVAPLWTSFALYRFESNVRSSTILGLIGAGGIGFVLFENIKSFDYPVTAAIVIVIVVTVMLIDMVSAQIRKRLL